jgi:hypothetical protein
MRSCVKYPSPSIIRIIKSMRMKWTGHVAQMGKKRNMYRLQTEGATRKTKI